MTTCKEPLFKQTTSLTNMYTYFTIIFICKIQLITFKTTSQHTFHGLFNVGRKWA